MSDPVADSRETIAARGVRSAVRALIEALLEVQVVSAGDDFRFVQIGANDGVSFDWTYEFVTSRRLRGLVVEPLPDLFEALCRAYSSYPEVTPVNVAIHKTARDIDIYRVDPNLTSGLPEWAKAIASVDRNHHKKSGIPSDVIRTERVKCITLPELLSTYQVSRIDYLQIDVEGYDGAILEMVDLDRLRPAIIRFEHNVRREVMHVDDLLAWIERFRSSWVFRDDGYG